MTSVWIEKSNNRKAFHCINCGSMLFVYYGDVINIVPGSGFEKMMFPIEIHCRRHHKEYGICKMAYMIDGMTEV